MTYSLGDYQVTISERLHAIANSKEQKILVCHPNYTAVCACIYLTEKGGLSLDLFWGVCYELADKQLLVYYLENEGEVPGHD